ncbi:hypothetical protein Tco_0875474 [Tanacetum coccineum]|uniref:Uncharacterized protein n=1 Tax=Tanacetum coccineum TaxID=301880 RepID=A0ABQ5BSI5_9ASTR
MEILSGRSIRATCSPKPAPIPVGDLIGAILRAVSGLSQAMPAATWLKRGIWVPLLTRGGDCPMTAYHVAVLKLQVQVAADMSVRGMRWQEQVVVNDWWQVRGCRTASQSEDDTWQ